MRQALEEERGEKEELEAARAAIEEQLQEATSQAEAQRAALDKASAEQLSMRDAMAELKQQAQEMAHKAQADAEAAAAKLAAATQDLASASSALEQERLHSISLQVKSIPLLAYEICSLIKYWRLRALTGDLAMKTTAGLRNPLEL